MAKTTDAKYFKPLPEFVQNSESRKRWERRFKTPEMFQTIVRDYYRLVTGMDREIGRIVAELNVLASRRTRSSSSRPTTAISSASTAWPTSGISTRNRSACR